MRYRGFFFALEKSEEVPAVVPPSRPPGLRPLREKKEERAEARQHSVCEDCEKNKKLDRGR